MLLAGEIELWRSFVDSGFLGATDPSGELVATEVVTNMLVNENNWTWERHDPPSGRTYVWFSPQVARLQFQMVCELRKEDTSQTRAALRRWFPPPNATLEWWLRVASTEMCDDFFGSGQLHCCLLAAALHGRLGQWTVAAQLAEKVAATCFAPINRIEALRMLSKALQQAGGAGATAAAAEALQQAAEIAAKAQYVAAEAVVARDRLRLFRGTSDETGALQALTELQERVQRMVAEPEELETLLGAEEVKAVKSLRRPSEALSRRVMGKELL